jgi:glucose-6-phosphate 1-dehydrogenase
MSQPLIFTLFGSTGDLAQKKIMPALYYLYLERRLPQQFHIIAFSRRAWSNADYHAFIKPFLKELPEANIKLDSFLEHVVYCEGQFHDETAYKSLAEKINVFKKDFHSAQTLFYFAVQPEFHESILNGLSAVGLLASPQAKIFVEKPFGNDAHSALELEKQFEKKVKANQVLHVDHYLAKEGLRDVIEKRKTHKELEAKLNHVHVASIHVRMFEKIGIEGRGDFYERIGALMDVGQNHLLQILATLLMDLDQKDENKARAKAIASLHIVGEPVLAQYEGYIDEPEVDPESQTETFFHIEAQSSLSQWRDVAITLEAGKAMAEKRADIVIHFKDKTTLTFDIQKSLTGRDAYDILIEEAMLDQHGYFASIDEIVAAWHFLEPILKKRATLLLQKYPKGTNGPLQ